MKRIYDERQLAPYISPEEYAALKGISTYTARKMCREGAIPGAAKVGPKLWRIDKRKALEVNT